MKSPGTMGSNVEKAKSKIVARNNSDLWSNSNWPIIQIPKVLFPTFFFCAIILTILLF